MPAADPHAFSALEHGSVGRDAHPVEGDARHLDDAVVVSRAYGGHFTPTTAVRGQIDKSGRDETVRLLTSQPVCPCSLRSRSFRETSVQVGAANSKQQRTRGNPHRAIHERRVLSSHPTIKEGYLVEKHSTGFHITRTKKKRGTKTHTPSQRAVRLFIYWTTSDHTCTNGPVTARPSVAAHTPLLQDWISVGGTMRQARGTTEQPHKLLSKYHKG